MRPDGAEGAEGAACLTQAALLAPVTTALWSIGLVLYLMVVTPILMHWLSEPMTPTAFGPPYWIVMGATAISVL